ncbi:MAG TPA: ergothioneine biosynthesis protein EgtC [Leptolyngbyaceae cyanobacterium]
MCRLLAYLGPTTSLEKLIIEPDHSLIKQSYQPRELEGALLNADGFGMAWYHPNQQTEPFLYRNTLPIWNDTNLPHLCRYVESSCVLAYVRSATPGLAVEMNNCQPFQQGTLTFVHNGFIEQFRRTLYRPIREMLCDRAYQSIHGMTDSEHIFALLLHQLETNPGYSLQDGLQATLTILTQLAAKHSVKLLANIVVSDGNHLVVSRYATAGSAPSLYWLRHHPRFPEAVLVASEPLFEADWVTCPDPAIITVDLNCDLQTHPLKCSTNSSVSIPLAS